MKKNGMTPVKITMAVMAASLSLMAAGCGNEEAAVEAAETQAAETTEAKHIEIPAKTAEAEKETAESENTAEDADIEEDVAEEAAEEETETEDEAVEEEPVENYEEGDAIDYYLENDYKEIMDLYYKALSEKWDLGACYENGISPLMSYHSEGDPLEEVGFALEDLDFDGYYELMIGAVSDNGNPVLYELYTSVDGKPVNLATSYDRQRYYLEWHEEGVYEIAYEASNSAANSAWYYYVILDKKLEMVQGVVFDAMADEENPWFLTYDEDWDTSNDTPDEERMAEAIIESHTRVYMTPEYIPFSYYAP